MTHNLRADTITITGHRGDEIEAYLAVPTDAPQVGSMIIIHHMPGYDRGTKQSQFTVATDVVFHF